MKAIALMSGGLDSCLAVKVVQEQGIEVMAVNFAIPFCEAGRLGGSCGAAGRLAGAEGIDLRTVHLGKEFLDMVAHPKHGWGKNMNPCIDCRILMLRRAAELLQPAGAKFVVTGEVLGQRPMSQHMHALKLVEAESGLPGLVLRPLSAKLLPPTIPETEGWVDRERLLAIGGRSRKEQFALAKKYGIADPPTPAGGCLLTDPGYATRLRDLLNHKGEITAHDATLIRFGRYVRLTPKAFAMVGRNEGENNQLESMQGEDEYLFKPAVCAGPSAIGTGELGEPERVAVAAKVARYSDNPAGGAVAVTVRLGKSGPVETIDATPDRSGPGSSVQGPGLKSDTAKFDVNAGPGTPDAGLFQETAAIASPDGRLAVFFGLDGAGARGERSSPCASFAGARGERSSPCASFAGARGERSSPCASFAGAPVFGVRRDGMPVILPSGLWLEFTPDWSSSGWHIAGIRQAVVSDAAPLIATGAVIDSCQEMTIALEERAETHFRLTLVFRAYNTGIALKYVLPEQAGMGEFTLCGERTEFRLADGRGENTDPDRIMDLPATLESGDGPTLTFSESEPEGYARTCAQGLGDGARGLAFRLVPGAVVKGHTPFSSPWRVLVIGEGSSS
jgi:tRNA U34 2-thiouridine synthase MnmA/TrmU